MCPTTANTYKYIHTQTHTRTHTEKHTDTHTNKKHMQKVKSKNKMIYMRELNVCNKYETK